jgi:hypothetical protein
MSAARALGLVYVAIASVFGVAIALQQHPDWQRSAAVTGTAFGRFVSDRIAAPVEDLGRRTVAMVTDRLAGRTGAPHRVARVVHGAAKARVASAPPAPVLERPVSSAPARLQLAQRPAMSLAPLPPPVSPGARAELSPAELSRVVIRLKQNLTQEMYATFELFLYVSKAEHGPWAQHMYVFEKQANGDLKLDYDWTVSTGEEIARLNDHGQLLKTDTPPGYYELDPNRFYTRYHSVEWNKPMPYAMFFNWVDRGRQTGLAIHGADGADEIAVLGKRASAGCVRLAPENAKTLFQLIRGRYYGLAPRFAYDRRTGTMSNDGILLHDPTGHVQLADGYKVLVFIENYGGENVVAALY